MSLKDRFAKALQKKAKKGFAGYPMATIAYYGPTDKMASKIAVSIVHAEGEEPRSTQRWLNESADIRRDPEILEKVLAFVRENNVKSVAMMDRIIGCPHEEGIDYPEGVACPRCQYWANRDRWTGELLDREQAG